MSSKHTTTSLSAPGWTMATIASLTLLSQLPNLYDPSSFMEQFDIQSAQAARLIGKSLALQYIHASYSRHSIVLLITGMFLAFLLVLINVYDLFGAFQDNYSVYYFSLLWRAAAAYLLLTFGPLWMVMVGFESATLVALGAAILWEKR